MLVCESMDACIFICTVAKLSICCSSRPIPSIEFSPTNSPEDEEKIFVHSNPLKQVHIVYTSVTKLSLVERLVLLHPLDAMDGNVITVRGHRNVIMCKISDRPPPHRFRAVMARRTKTASSLVIRCHRSVNQSLGWTGQMRALASLHSTTFSFCTTHATTTHNKKYLHPRC
jgi:hypothetical protein